jgi:hypothetical protein
MLESPAFVKGLMKKLSQRNVFSTWLIQSLKVDFSIKWSTHNESSAISVNLQAAYFHPSASINSHRIAPICLRIAHRTAVHISPVTNNTLNTSLKICCPLKRNNLKPSIPTDNRNLSSKTFAFMVSVLCL